MGEWLSLSITNKYGDILTNPTVAQILSDGLILQRGATEWKVRYADPPPSIREKYQPMASGVIKKEEKEGAANAAYFAYTQKLQTEQSYHLAAQAAQENKQAAARGKSQAVIPNENIVVMPIPDQNWKLTTFNLGFRDWEKQEDHNQFVLHGLARASGFNFVLFVKDPANNLPGNDPAYNFFWLNMGNNSLIDAQLVRAERRDKFIKVFYTAHGQPNVNYFFAYQNKWVDIHLSKPAFEPETEN